jgi:hypothetical protein
MELLVPSLIQHAAKTASAPHYQWELAEEWWQSELFLSRIPRAKVN